MSFFADIYQLLLAGGKVLWVILWVAIVLWALVFERLLYFRSTYLQHRKTWIAGWQQRTDKHSKYARYLKKCIISEATISLNRSMPLITVLISLCPLLGLLGTVTGMMQVFDSMASTTSGNIRAMAAGVSQATIPTMAGMVITITGLYANNVIGKKIAQATRNLSDSLQ